MQQFLVNITRLFLFIFFKTFYFIEYHGSHNIPREGGVIIASNHQSFYDPTILAVKLSRKMNFMARKSLFTIPLFGSLIRFYGAFPVNRDVAGKDTIKTTLKALRGAEIVIMFPEATRTRDGSLRKFKPGLARIALMTGATVVPTTIKGAFLAWPRDCRLPRIFRKITVTFHDPIPVDRSQDKAAFPQKIEEINTQMLSAIQSSLGASN